MKIDAKVSKNLKNYLLNVIPDVAKNGYEQVRIISAVRLDEKDINVVKEKFRDLNWDNVVYEIDTSILAGIIIKVGSKQIDLSLSGSLLRLSNKLYEID